MKKKYTITLIITVVALVLVGVVGLSYAYYVSTVTETNTDNRTTSIKTAAIANATMNLGTKVTGDGVFPGYKTVKEVTVTGSCSSPDGCLSIPAFIEIDANIPSSFNTDVTWKLYKSNTPITCTNNQVTINDNEYYVEDTCSIPNGLTPVKTGNKTETVYYEVEVNGNTNDNYYLVVEYANNNNQDNQQGLTFTINLAFLIEKPDPTGKTLAKLQALNNTIKLNESMNSNTGTCPTVNDDGTVNVTAKEESASLLCEAPDEYGTSYYFRGNVTNNYVSFAGAIWRIIRINGDGSIRMIYDGTQAYGNNANTSDRHIGKKSFNNSYDRNAYVGYMYKNASGNSYSNTFNMVGENKAFLISSTIKGSASDATTIDGWYKANIVDKNLEGYIADNLFCNDKNFAANNTGTGVTTSTTYYRWRNGPWTSGANQNKPRLTCKNTTNLVDIKNDAFTVSDTEHGNAALTYPVALITTDEVVLAGGYNEQSINYLTPSTRCWTMSPRDFAYSDAGESYLDVGGYAHYSQRVNYDYCVRPVLSLSSNTIFSAEGNGTKDSPLVVDVSDDTDFQPVG